MHVIEYDGKSLINDIEDKTLDTAHPPAPMTSNEYSNSLQHIPIPLPVHAGQPSMDSGVTVGGTYFLAKIILLAIKPKGFLQLFFGFNYFLRFVHKPSTHNISSSKPSLFQDGKSVSSLRLNRVLRENSLNPIPLIFLLYHYINLF